VAKDAGFFESFRIADDVLRQGVQGISDIITIPGIINRDFADVKTTMAGMGHAVMGTAIRSGDNRAVEAAQAAMASPLLEAGAIDGARGILINITGSSSLRLSEVNAASSLIQSAAHEDANIIFGAVLDEKMGDEVKITVIATGFREQMPERRARMLSVLDNGADAPLVSSVPVVSVPVMAAENWLREPVAPVASKEAASQDSPAVAPLPAAPARFLSEDEEEEETAEDAEADASFFFSSGGASILTPALITALNVDAPLPETEMETRTEFEPEPARPRFAELAEEPSRTPPYSGSASDFDSSLQVMAAREERRVQTASTLFSESDEESLRDLDTPTFMRRLQF